MSACRLCSRDNDTSWDVCDACGITIARRYRTAIVNEYLTEERAKTDRARRADEDRRRRELAARPVAHQPVQQGPVVYYVRIGNHVKIGYSARLASRLKTLRVTLDDLLAIEPGGRRLEQKRHEEFAHLRVRPRWEDFTLDDDLAAHIASLRSEHGIPEWTTAPRRGSKHATPVVVRHVEPRR